MFFDKVHNLHTETIRAFLQKNVFVFSITTNKKNIRAFVALYLGFIPFQSVAKSSFILENNERIKINGILVKTNSTLLINFAIHYTTNATFFLICFPKSIC